MVWRRRVESGAKHRGFDNRFRGTATLLDKSVCFCAEEDAKYGFGKGLRGKCIGRNEKGILRSMEILAQSAKREVIGVLISHVGDMLISVSYLCISLLSGRLGNEFGANAF